VDIGDAFPSKYLRPKDLGTAAPVVTIAAVRLERVGQRQIQKPVCYFVGKTKGLILNKTNATTIAQLLGTPQTEAWAGRQVRLYATDTTFGKDTVPCIRVKAAVRNVVDFAPGRRG
jgi:hypothetical protein